MYTSAELQLLRDAIGGAKIPGIDTPTGNQLPAASLIKASTLPAAGTPSAAARGYFYDAKNNRVIVTKDGVTLSGIDFGSIFLQISANNVTVNNCSFEPTTGSVFSVVQYGSGATIENSTFTGPKYSTQLADFIHSSFNPITIKGNSFINGQSDDIELANGVVTGNYFSGSGYQKGAHADAIWVTGTTTSAVISNNFIDWTNNPDAAIWTNNAIRLTNEGGPTRNVTISGNYLLGGVYSMTVGGTSNIKVSGNYTGFSLYGALYPVTMGATFSGNVSFDWRNTSYSSSAWTSYLAGGLPTSNLVVATTTANFLNSSAKPTTIYGAGQQGVHLFGMSAAETNFVGGFGRQYLILGSGANIVTELSVSDSSTATGQDIVSGFDPSKDVIDLSRIDANLTAPGMQSFTFIGDAAFSGTGAQIRYQQNTSTNTTTVEAKLAGDPATVPFGNSPAELSLTLSGLVSLSAVNFALTAAQSKAAASAAASVSVTKTNMGQTYDYLYTGVQGRGYASYQSIASGGTTVAQNFDLSTNANQVSLTGSNVTITRGSSAESIAAGTGSFAQTYRPNETIQIAPGAGSETFNLGTNFGSETINGFVTSGATADTVILPVSSFSYLNSGMTQAQDLAAVLGNATSGAGGLTIHDSFGNALTLGGATASTLASSSSIRFA